MRSFLRSMTALSVPQHPPFATDEGAWCSRSPRS
jgi:hypothetical protein